MKGVGLIMNIAVDLLWVRHNQVGGIETYIRNLLDGFCLLDEEFHFTLLVSKDNGDTFQNYKNDKRFSIETCDIRSSNVFKRIVWQNMFFGKKIKELGLDLCFEPYYCKPITGIGNIDFVTTIHDLQALYYPQYVSKVKALWMRISWYNTIKSSKKIVAISNYVGQDILKNYKFSQGKVVSIYNAASVDTNGIPSSKEIENKYGVKEKEYYFTLSSLLPHKNLETLLRVIDKIVKSNIALPRKLIISGVGGKERGNLENKISELGLKDYIQLTPFISNADMYALYKYCYVFLFPSIYEGYGMPPIEAMLLGTPVVTTRRTSIEEVTQGKANYVDDPFNVDEWIDRIQHKQFQALDFSVYDKKNVAKQYYDLFLELMM